MIFRSGRRGVDVSAGGPDTEGRLASGQAKSQRKRGWRQGGFIPFKRSGRLVDTPRGEGASPPACRSAAGPDRGAEESNGKRRGQPVAPGIRSRIGRRTNGGRRDGLAGRARPSGEGAAVLSGAAPAAAGRLRARLPRLRAGDPQARSPRAGDPSGILPPRERARGSRPRRRPGPGAGEARGPAASLRGDPHAGRARALRGDPRHGARPSRGGRRIPARPLPGALSGNPRERDRLRRRHGPGRRLGHRRGRRRAGPRRRRRPGRWAAGRACG